MTTNNTFNSITEIEEAYDITLDIPDDVVSDEIIVKDVFNSKLVIPLDSDKISLVNIQALYYQYIEEYDVMKKYYLMAIEKGSVSALFNLASYYETIDKNYDDMKKYYLMAIDKGCVSSMYNLAAYYQTIVKKYDDMKKYYLMAIDKGCASSMNNIAYYYQHIERNYDDMKKYYLMAIDKGSVHSMFNIALYYETIKENHDDMKKYYLMAIVKDKTFIGRLSDTAKTVILTEIINDYADYEQMKRKIEHFKYHPNGWGFKGIEDEWNLLCSIESKIKDEL